MYGKYLLTEIEQHVNIGGTAEVRASLTSIRPGEVVGMTFMTKKLVLQQMDRSFLQRTVSCSPVVPTTYLSNNSKGAKGHEFFFVSATTP